MRLLLTVRWFDSRYHGLLGRDGDTEWPPSPFRLFQAIVAGIGSAGGLDSCAAETLRWFQNLPPPTIIAPRILPPGKSTIHYVPNNDGDVKPDRQDRLKAKIFRPCLIVDKPEIHYVWKVKNYHQEQVTLLSGLARFVTALGWGIDVAFAHGRMINDDDIDGLKGVRWEPRVGVEAETGMLRVPWVDPITNEETFGDLERAHQAALDRLQSDEALRIVSKPRVFQKIYYQGPSNPLAPTFAAFSLLKMDASGYQAFDPVRNGMRVAGMLRHSAGKISGQGALADAVMGHGEEGGDRVAYVPLPSIEGRGPGKAEVIGSVRRVLLVGVRGFKEADLIRLAQRIASEPLQEEGTDGKEVALLSRLPKSDKMVARYTRESATWATVTPMILPGYDDPRGYRKRLNAAASGGEILNPETQADLLTKLDKRTEGLIRKAIVQGGFSEEMARLAIVEWSGTGFWPGVDLASRYSVPETLRRYRRVHVRIRWRDNDGSALKVPGPICLGSGRFVGVGLFARQE